MPEPAYQANTYDLADLDCNKARDPALEGFTRIIDVWLAARDHGFLPRRGDLHIRNFAGWHARMIIFELPDDGNLTFRLVGEDVGEMFGTQVKVGSRFSDLPNVAFEDYADYFRAIKAGGVYGRYSGMVPFRGREHRTFDVLDLPVADAAGETAYLYSFFLKGPRP